MKVFAVHERLLDYHILLFWDLLNYQTELCFKTALNILPWLLIQSWLVFGDLTANRVSWSTPTQMMPWVDKYLHSVIFSLSLSSSITHSLSSFHMIRLKRKLASKEIHANEKQKKNKTEQKNKQMKRKLMMNRMNEVHWFDTRFILLLSLLASNTRTMSPVNVWNVKFYDNFVSFSEIT